MFKIVLNVKIWRVKCNGKYLKHMADASGCVLALYHLKHPRRGFVVPFLKCGPLYESSLLSNPTLQTRPDILEMKFLHSLTHGISLPVSSCLLNQLL